MRRLRGLKLLLTGVGTTLLFLGLAPASASSANISHSYHAASAITNGSIVSLDSSQAGAVQLANANNGARLLGVALSSTDSLLAVDPTAGAVQVATSGNVNTLVSTINGDINVGDQIAVSPFDGVGMKSLPGTHVIGVAQTAFSASSSGASVQQVTNKSGQKSSVQLGYINISIAIGTDTTNGGNAPLSGLQKVAKSLTGHTISNTRIILSLAVATVALLALIILIYASIYGSIISIGRNPLAKYAVFRTLGAVLLMALLTTGIAGMTIFFLLR